MRDETRTHQQPVRFEPAMKDKTRTLMKTVWAEPILLLRPEDRQVFESQPHPKQQSSVLSFVALLLVPLQL